MIVKTFDLSRLCITNCTSIATCPFFLSGVNPLSNAIKFGTSLDPVVLHSVSCSGNEATLLDCQIDTDTAQDTHMTDAGVECITKGRN